MSRSPDSQDGLGGVAEVSTAFIHDAAAPAWTPHRPVRPPKSLPGKPFKLVSDYDAAGDQPTAIAELVEGINQRARTLLEESEVVNHLALIERMRFEEQFDLVGVAVDRVRTAPGAAATDDVGVLELEQLADQHAARLSPTSRTPQNISKAFSIIDCGTSRTMKTRRLFWSL